MARCYARDAANEIGRALQVLADHARRPDASLAAGGSQYYETTVKLGSHVRQTLAKRN